MAKATEPVTTNPSRRVLLAGVPAAAVTVAWGRERALSKPATGDDAELLALKPRFDPVFAAWVAMSTAERERHRLCVGLYERETGLKWDDRPAINWNDPAFVACRQARSIPSADFVFAELQHSVTDRRRGLVTGFFAM